MTTIRAIEKRIERERNREPIRGSDLRAAREQARVAGAHLARYMGVTRQYVAKIEGYDAVSVRTADRYAEALRAATS